MEVALKVLMVQLMELIFIGALAVAVAAVAAGLGVMALLVGVEEMVEGKLA